MSAKEAHVAIVGDGPAALATLAVLRDAGVEASDIVIYGDSPHPLARLERYAHAVGQERMRSEGDGHLSPAGFPGLALIDSWRSRSVGPALAAVFNLYTPPLGLLLDDAAEVAEHAGFARCHTRVRVGRLVREEAPRRTFLLEDEAGAPISHARHVILALGHPGLRWAPAADFWRRDPRMTHAYQTWAPRDGEHIVVLGGGMAAAHAWLAALAAGASVTALHRQPLVRQQLNAPRCMFSAVGIEAYQALGPADRLARLRGQGGSFPRRRAWERRLKHARKAGRLREHRGELQRIETAPSDSGGPLLLRLRDGAELRADRLVCATGFEPDARGHLLVRRLIVDYKVDVGGGLLRVADDFTLPPLSNRASTLAVVGTPSEEGVALRVEQPAVDEHALGGPAVQRVGATPARVRV
jgi:cation diffusion facilitator CzcD-associated flavoprotein CzcO